MCLSLLTGCSSAYYVVFSSGRDGDSNIYRMDTDGSKQEALTEGKTEDWAPSITPDGRIAYLSDDLGFITRRMLDPWTGSDVEMRHTTYCYLDDKNAQFDTRSRQLYQCNDEIYLFEPGDSSTVHLTEKVNGRSFNAVFGHDETYIIFTNNWQTNLEIFRMDLTTLETTNLSNTESNEDVASVSPDGNKLLFTSNRAGTRNQELYIQDLTTGAIINITNTPDWELIGRWSPDGKHIFFGSNRDGNWELYSFELKSGETVRLTFNEAFDGDPRMVRSLRSLDIRTRNKDMRYAK